jgi:ABC-2 type transport system ATP-binding protein
MSAVIWIRHLIKQFNELVAVNGLSLDIMGGEDYGLLVPNGAGKPSWSRL